MKKILFTSLAVLGLGITGCSNEDLGVAKSGVDEVCATMGDAESRTAMNGNSVVWSTGDEIGIFERMEVLLLILTLTIHYPVEPGPRMQSSQEYWKVMIL